MGQPAVAGDEKTGSSDADGDGLSTLKAAKNSGTWWSPSYWKRWLIGVLEESCLEWATVYFGENVCRTKQRNRYRTGPRRNFK